jgi:hypothetical protein
MRRPAVRHRLRCRMSWSDQGSVSAWLVQSTATGLLSGVRSPSGRSRIMREKAPGCRGFTLVERPAWLARLRAPRMARFVAATRTRVSASTRSDREDCLESPIGSLRGKAEADATHENCRRSLMLDPWTGFVALGRKKPFAPLRQAVQPHRQSLTIPRARRWRDPATGLLIAKG